MHEDVFSERCRDLNLKSATLIDHYEWTLVGNRLELHNLGEQRSLVYIKLRNRKFGFDFGIESERL